MKLMMNLSWIVLTYYGRFRVQLLEVIVLQGVGWSELLTHNYLTLVSPAYLK